MNEPPQVITTKDLLYLEDALSWELLASKRHTTLQLKVRIRRSGSIWNIWPASISGIIRYC